jgi:hypothetical protein
MATSDRDDHEDREEKDEAAKGESPEAKAGDAAERNEARAKPRDDEGDAPDDDEAPAEKKAAPAKPPSGKPLKRPGATPAKGARGPGAARGKPAPAKGGSLSKSMLLFFVLVGGVMLVVAVVTNGNSGQDAPPKPKWKTGETVDVEITLVKNDKQDLACSSTDEIAGKHCAFEANNKPWSKGDNTDDKKVLRPYTTTEHIQFTAAGLWSDPALAPDKLPAMRFSVKCKYKVEGTVKSLGVRWEQTGQWFPNSEWFAGGVSDCKILP